MATDIVICTHNRLHLLKETIRRIQQATAAPYRLHVIDDGSQAPTREWLWQQYQAGDLASLVLRKDANGRMTARNIATWLTFSDPFVLVDDDILCPMLEDECWLTRMLSAMRICPQVGIMALNHPGALREDYGHCTELPGLVLCRVVGNTFMMVRRAVVEGWYHPHYEQNFGVIDEHQRCDRAHEAGYLVGYLSTVFCYHMGLVGADGQPYAGPDITPTSWLTLEAHP